MPSNGDNSEVIPTAPPPPYDSVVNQPARNPYFNSTANSSEHNFPDNEPMYMYPLLPNVSAAISERLGWCKLKKSVIIFSLIFVVVLSIVAGLTTFYMMVAFGHLEQYGRKCTPADYLSCGTTNLICLDSGICGCKSSDYKWDQQQGLCVALANSNAECKKWGWDGSYAIPCTQNAVCNDEYRCECSPYFVEIGHECIASYDAICSSSKDCNQPEFLFCGKNGKCQCRPGTVRHLKSNAFGCFVNIGETCAGRMRDLCVDPNSECTKEQICRCNKKKGYIPSRENMSCGKTANNTCDTVNDCADTLSCLKTAITDPVGVCNCLNSEILHENKQKCLIKAGRRCEISDLKQCVEHAVCKQSTCVCNKGWGLDEASGLCLGTHGTICTTNENCLGSHYFQCIEGKCGCDKNHTHFSEASGSCFGNVTDTMCVSDNNCDQQRMACDHKSKMCTCKRGLEEDNKSCYGSRGTGCAETRDCFRLQYLTCLEGSCSCNSASEKWEEDQCKLQFHQRCGDPVNRFSMECVGNLTCLIDPTHTSDVFKLCGCESKYVVSDDKRRCVSSVNSVHTSVFALLCMFVIATLL